MEIATGGWVMSDEASAPFAAMLDNLVEGHDWLLRHFNGTVRRTVYSTLDSYS